MHRYSFDLTGMVSRNPNLVLYCEDLMESSQKVLIQGRNEIKPHESVVCEEKWIAEWSIGFYPTANHSKALPYSGLSPFQHGFWFWGL